MASQSEFNSPRRLSRTSLDLGSRRRSTRIEKPKNANVSPSFGNRRKTISTVKQYPSLDDHYRAMFGDVDDMDEVDDSSSRRPYSWHPSSFYSTADASSQLPSYAPSPSGLMPLQADGQVSPIQVNGTSSTAPSSAASGSSTSPASAEQDGSSWQSYFDGQTPVFANFNQANAGYDASGSWYVPDYSQLVQSQPQLLESSVPFPATRMQVQSPQQYSNGTADDDEAEDDDSEELVGLGLYDPPEPSTLLGTAPSKILKLVETWQPPEPSSDDDADGEDDDDDADQDEAEPSKAREEKTVVPVASSMSQPETATNETQPVRNMAGQSFFFDDNDSTVVDEWWYKQLKQPGLAPAAVGGLGYDWISSR
jgi:hypothetical protein